MRSSHHPRTVDRSLVATMLTARPWKYAAVSTAGLALVAVGVEFLHRQALVQTAGVTVTVATLGSVLTAVYWGWVDRAIGLFAAVASSFATVGSVPVGDVILGSVGVVGTLVLASATVTLPAWLLLGVVAGLTGQYELREDRLRIRAAIPFRSAEEVLYEDIEVVIRSRDLGDRLAGGASYELVRSKESNFAVLSVADPDAFEQVLNTEVTEPSRQIEQSHRFNNQFWYLWPDYTDAPPDPVVDEAELSDWLDTDVGDLRLNRLDAACERDIEDLNEVDSDFEVPDAGGGGSDGGTDSDVDDDVGGGDFDGGGIDVHDF